MSDIVTFANYSIGFDAADRSSRACLVVIRRETDGTCTVVHEAYDEQATALHEAFLAARRPSPGKENDRG